LRKKALVETLPVRETGQKMFRLRLDQHAVADQIERLL
jgi:hypothetical protein